MQKPPHFVMSLFGDETPVKSQATFHDDFIDILLETETTSVRLVLTHEQAEKLRLGLHKALVYGDRNASG